MYKKDYEMIARVLRECATIGEAQRESIARALASELLNTNKRFDAARFIDTCMEGNSK